MEYKTIVCQSEMNPDMGCVFKVKAEDFEKAKVLIGQGFFYWFYLTEDEKELSESYPDVVRIFGDDLGWVESCGYSELACEMLDNDGIWYDNEDSFARDEYGNFDDELVDEYDEWL